MAKNEDSSEFGGGCACGNIRYTCDEPALFSFHCQCTDCQKLSGTGHSSALVCKEDSSSISGELSWYERTASNGNVVSQGFCGNCGSPVLNRNSGYPGKLYITAGSLDDPQSFKPTAIVHRDEGHAWDFCDPES